jgi:hypothetical protein
MQGLQLHGQLDCCVRWLHQKAMVDLVADQLRQAHHLCASRTDLGRSNIYSPGVVDNVLEVVGARWQARQLQVEAATADTPLAARGVSGQLRAPSSTAALHAMERTRAACCILSMAPSWLGPSCPQCLLLRWPPTPHTARTTPPAIMCHGWVSAVHATCAVHAGTHSTLPLISRLQQHLTGCLDHALLHTAAQCQFCTQQGFLQSSTAQSLMPRAGQLPELAGRLVVLADWGCRGSLKIPAQGLSYSMLLYK